MNPDKYLPSVSVDCVIFGFHDSELRVLLLKLKNMEVWALPGGFIPVDKEMDSEAKEVLKQRTGLENIFLRQFYTFGNLERNRSRHVDALVEKDIIPESLRPWFSQRFISVGYYALVEYSKVDQPTPDLISETCDWISLSQLPPLMLDHDIILQKALDTVKRELHHQPIGLNLLPEEFTMTELQSLYETILGRKVDRRNFRRKMLSFNILKDTQKRRTGLNHKPPILYQFDEKEYRKALEAGFQSSGLFQ